MPFPEQRTKEGEHSFHIPLENKKYSEIQSHTNTSLFLLIKQ